MPCKHIDVNNKAILDDNGNLEPEMNIFLFSQFFVEHSQLKLFYYFFFTIITLGLSFVNNIKVKETLKPFLL